MVITAGPRIKVYKITDNTSTATPLFDQPLVSLEDFNNGPGGTDVETQFLTKAGNASAVSTVVQGANKCHGTFLAQITNGVFMVMFDPSGRFAAFTMVDNKGTATAADDTLRFGFSINDTGYVNQ